MSQRLRLAIAVGTSLYPEPGSECAPPCPLAKPSAVLCLSKSLPRAPEPLAVGFRHLSDCFPIFCSCAAVFSSVFQGICCLALALSFPWFALVCLQQFYGGWAATTHCFQSSLGSAVGLGYPSERSFLLFGWCGCERFGGRRPGMLEAGTGIWKKEKQDKDNQSLVFFFSPPDGWGCLGFANI